MWAVRYRACGRMLTPAINMQRLQAGWIWFSIVIMISLFMAAWCALCSSYWQRRLRSKMSLFFFPAWINTTRSPCWRRAAMSWNIFSNFVRLYFLQRGWNENLRQQCDSIVKLNKWIRMYKMFTMRGGGSVRRRQPAVCYNGNFSLVLFASELNNSGALLVCALITDKIRAGKLNCYQPLFVIATSKCL